ncbi:MAG: hypothetical protein ACK4SZ_02840 [Allosphingosinicella sp.]|uniref:hypothetical protein n=1 Tax=Allosphingosinicella sp. TaxID=2823234 RepID=UPI00392B8F01
MSIVHHLGPRSSKLSSLLITFVPKAIGDAEEVVMQETKVSEKHIQRLRTT